MRDLASGDGTRLLRPALLNTMAIIKASETEMILLNKLDSWLTTAHLETSYIPGAYVRLWCSTCTSWVWGLRAFLLRQDLQLPKLGTFLSSVLEVSPWWKL